MFKYCLSATCAEGYYYVSATACAKIPANAALIVGSWACNAGYQKNGTACAPCAFNTYRIWDPQTVSSGYPCAAFAKLTPREAGACAAGYYYAIASTSSTPGISCVPCTGPGQYYYYTKNITSNMTVSTLAVPNACITSRCPISTVAGMYTFGCGGTSPGYLKPCVGLPFSDAAGFGYHVKQTNTSGDCPVEKCTSCGTAANYQNLLCPALFGTMPGVCTSCPSVVPNGIVVPNYILQKCEVVCFAGYYLANGNACVACGRSCAQGYYAPRCAAAARLSVMRFILNQTTAVIIGGSWYNHTTENPQCTLCAPLGNATPMIPSAEGDCQWSCNIGYYFYQQKCLACKPPLSCTVGTYAYAPCRDTAGSTDAPACKSCVLPAYGAAFVGSGCNFVCQAGYWNSTRGCETPSACYAKEGYYFFMDKNQCLKCDDDSTENKWFPYGKDAPCEWFCIAGTYRVDHVCRLCGAGTYNTNTATLDTSCVSCAAGTYQPSMGAKKACDTLAPPNAQPNADASGYMCNAGYYRMADQICAPCAAWPIKNMTSVRSISFIEQTCTMRDYSCYAGYYRSASACIPCGYPTLPDEAVTDIMIANCSSECCERSYACRADSCSPGYYATGICTSYKLRICLRCGTVLCGAGMISTPCQSPQITDTCTALCDGDNMLRLNATYCACKPGFRVFEGGCKPCPPGTDASCVPCAIGTYSALGGGQCTRCGLEEVAERAGSTACYSPIPNPQCPPGFFLLNATCHGCPEGYYCQTSKTPCPWGTPAAPRMSSVVSQCAATAQLLCLRSASSVIPCPENTTNQNLRARSAAWCHPKEGYYGERGQPAAICPVDFFCPPCAMAPVACERNTFARQGSTQCSSVMVPPCRRGWYVPFPYTDSSCLPCPYGYYCNGDRIFACTGGASDASGCAYMQAVEPSCSDPTTMRYGDDAVCRPIAGFYLSFPTQTVMACPKGYYCPGNADPIPCPAAPAACSPGYKRVEDRCPAGTLIDGCTPCPWRANGGYTTENSCSDFCCNAGHYLYRGQECLPKQEACYEPSSFVPPYPPCTIGIQPCLPCPLNIGHANVTSVLGVCVYACRAGYGGDGCRPCTGVGVGGVCTHCALGYYSADAISCKACPLGTVGAPNGTCESCSFGKYAATACEPGLVRAAPWATCDACTAGSIAVDARCIPCAPGHYQHNSTTCVACREDEEYMPFSGATACMPCTFEACGCRKGSHYDVTSKRCA